MVINDFDELMSKRESVQDINRMLNMNTGELTALVKFCYVLTHGENAMRDRTITPDDVLRELKEITRVRA
jgi:hypothetical protein